MIWRVPCKIYPDFYRVHPDFSRVPPRPDSSRVLTWFFFWFTSMKPSFFQAATLKKKTGRSYPQKNSDSRLENSGHDCTLENSILAERKDNRLNGRVCTNYIGEIWCLQSDFLEESEQFFLPMKINWKTNACKLSYLKLTNTTINLEAHWINHKLRRSKKLEKSPKSG